jgi:hypothetical protein
MTHRCYACSSANVDRVFAYEGGASARFPLRFNGPPGSANGGIATGALACPALAREAGAKRVERIQARLRSAVVCDRALDVVVSETAGVVAAALHLDGAPLIDGVVTLAEHDASDAPADLDRLARAAIEGTSRPPFFEETGDHPIAGCFSCGPDNTRGMRIFPRVVEDGLTCADWMASDEFDDGDATVSPMIVASALDCSSGICMPIEMQRELLREDRFFLLGSLDVRFLRGVPVSGDYRVVAQAGARDGRKFFGRSALFDRDGAMYATADATWIIAGISRTEAFGAR